MPNVTPNLMGGAGPASQSLQGAAAGVRQGGESATAAVSNLTAILAQMNQQIVGAFQQQAKEADQQKQILVQSVADSVEKMTNAVQSNAIRKRDRRESMEDFKTQTDYEIGARGKEADRQRSIELALAADQRRQNELIQGESRKILANLPKAKQEIAALQSAIASIQEAIPNIDDPEARAGANNLLLSVQSRLGRAASVPEELISLAEQAASAKSIQLAEEAISGRKLGTESPPIPAIDPKMAFDPATIKALKGWADVQVPGANYDFLNPDDPNLAAGDVETLAHALRFNALDSKMRDEEGRRKKYQELTRVGLETKVIAEEFGNAQKAFEGQLASIAGSTVQTALRTVAVQPERHVSAKTPDGRPVGSVPNGKEIFTEIRKQMARPFGPQVEAALEQYYAGEKIVDVQAMMPIAALATAIDSVTHTTLKEAVEKVGVGNLVDDTAWGSDVDLNMALTREVDRAIAHCSASASKARLMKQPAPAALQQQLRLTSVFLRGLSTDKVLPDVTVDADALKYSDKDQVAQTSVDFDPIRVMREAAEAIDESDLYLGMANFLMEGKSDPSVSRLVQITQPQQPQAAGGIAPYGAQNTVPGGEVSQGQPAPQMSAAGTGPMPQPAPVPGVPTGPQVLNPSQTNDLFNQALGGPKPQPVNETLLGRSSFQR